MAKYKLKSALDRYKGRDFAGETDKKLRKKAEKAQRAKGIIPAANGKKRKAGEEEDWEDEDEDEEDDEEVPTLVDADATLDSDEDEEGDDEEDDEGEEDDEEEEYSDVPLSDIENDDDLEVPDLIPHQRLTINNKTALTTAHNRIALPFANLPFVEHLAITASKPTEIKDIHDDLSRELAFYSQALSAACAARQILVKEGIPFSRPLDYFAEMVKTDEHMGKVKQKLLEEVVSKKAAQEARKQRDLRKFGKQVQFAKLQERDKAKRDTLEKIQLLKRSTLRVSHRLS